MFPHRFSILITQQEVHRPGVLPMKSFSFLHLNYNPGTCDLDSSFTNGPESASGASVGLLPDLVLLMEPWDKFVQVSVQFSRSVVSDSLRPHESQHARPPCPSPTPGAYTNSCPSRRWCHPAISSSVAPFSFCPQSLPASGSFPMSQLYTSGGQSTGASASASVLPINTQDWSPLG